MQGQNIKSTVLNTFNISKLTIFKTEIEFEPTEKYTSALCSFYSVFEVVIVIGLKRFTFQK